MIYCERLVFLAPSIEKLISSPILKKFCISPIRSTQPYLKCCYISFQNFLIELLEVTDISFANQFVFFEEAKNLSKPKWVGIGLTTPNLDMSLEVFKKSDVHALEYFTSTSSLYKNGYKHKSALLNIKWFEKLVYVSDYDPQFFKERESEITTDLAKKNIFSVVAPKAVEPFLQAPSFLQLIDSIPQIEVKTTDNPQENILNCEWVTLKISGLA